MFKSPSRFHWQFLLFSRFVIFYISHCRGKGQKCPFYGRKSPITWEHQGSFPELSEITWVYNVNLLLKIQMFKSGDFAKISRPSLKIYKLQQIYKFVRLNSKLKNSELAYIYFNITYSLPEILSWTHLKEFILKILTSCATHVENFLSQNCNIFSVLSIFKYNPKRQNK